MASSHGGHAGPPLAEALMLLISNDGNHRRGGCPCVWVLLAGFLLGHLIGHYEIKMLAYMGHWTDPTARLF